MADLDRSQLTVSRCTEFWKRIDAARGELVNVDMRGLWLANRT